MDGLVSTGNKFPYTILEINFFNQKKFLNYFINIFYRAVDKPTCFHDHGLLFLFSFFIVDVLNGDEAMKEVFMCVIRQNEFFRREMHEKCKQV